MNINNKKKFTINEQFFILLFNGDKRFGTTL